MANLDASDETKDRPLNEGGSPESQFSALLAVAPPGSGLRHVPIPLDLLADTGEPVDVPPPLIEPIFIGFDEPSPAADPQRAEPQPRPGLAARLRATQPSRLLSPLREIGAQVSRRAGALARPAGISALAAVRRSDEAATRLAARLAHYASVPFQVLRSRLSRPAAATPEPVAAATAKRVAELVAGASGKPAVAPPDPVVAEAREPATDIVAKPAVLPAAEPAAEPTPKSAAVPVQARLPVVVRQWRDAVVPKPGDGGWFYWARLAGGAAIVGAIIFFAGFGPLHRPNPGSVAPLADAPSDPALRLAYFQRGADAGDAEAELQLAILYAKGEGVKQDYTIAARWFRAAAEQGSARAQYDLGVLYERGRGITADSTEAARWYRKAAEGKYPLAQYNLAVAYTKGEGIRKDPSEAALWYRRAAAQGVVQAMVNLGMLYERGEGVTASQVDAYAWYLAAGRRGNQPAARRAEDLFGMMAQLDQIRAQVLARDVASSIHDPTPGRLSGG